MEKAGFEFLGYGKGDHMKVVRREPKQIIVIPDDAELARGTLKAILRAAGVSNEEFIDLLS